MYKEKEREAVKVVSRYVTDKWRQESCDEDICVHDHVHRRRASRTAWISAVISAGDSLSVPT